VVDAEDKLRSSIGITNGGSYDIGKSF